MGKAGRRAGDLRGLTVAATAQQLGGTAHPEKRQDREIRAMFNAVGSAQNQHAARIPV